MDVRQILRIRASGHIQRCHTNQHHGIYTVAEHVGQAMSLMFVLHPDPSLKLIRALTFHDHPELWTGDIPAPAKRKHPDMRAMLQDLESLYFAEHPLIMRDVLSKDELRWLKAIDCLELYLWCRDQELLGNAHATLIARKVLGYIDEMDAPDEVRLFVNLEQRMSWEERCFE